MRFKSPRLLFEEAIEQYDKFPVESIEPCSIRLAPTYVALTQNKKLIAVKGPLDFFSEKELRKWLRFSHFYSPPIASLVTPFSQAGSAIREILKVKEEQKQNQPLPPSPLSLSRQVLDRLKGLWTLAPSGDLCVEPLALIAFNELLCEKISGPALVKARERSVARFEEALLFSSWSTFMALHLGYCNLSFINQVRSDSFQAFSSEETENLTRTLADELITMTREIFKSQSLNQVSSRVFDSLSHPASACLRDRLKYIKSEIKKLDPNDPNFTSLYGPIGESHGQ